MDDAPPATRRPVLRRAAAIFQIVLRARARAAPKLQEALGNRPSLPALPLDNPPSGTSLSPHLYRPLLAISQRQPRLSCDVRAFPSFDYSLT